MIGLGQGAISGDQQVFQAFLPSPHVAQLPHLIAHQFRDGRLVERGDRGAGAFEQGIDLGVRQVGNIFEILA